MALFCSVLDIGLIPGSSHHGLLSGLWCWAGKPKTGKSSRWFPQPGRWWDSLTHSGAASETHTHTRCNRMFSALTAQVKATGRWGASTFLPRTECVHEPRRSQRWTSAFWLETLRGWACIWCQLHPGSRLCVRGGKGSRPWNLIGWEEVKLRVKEPLIKCRKGHRGQRITWPVQLTFSRYSWVLWRSMVGETG